MWKLFSLLLLLVRQMKAGNFLISHSTQNTIWKNLIYLFLPSFEKLNRPCQVWFPSTSCKKHDVLSYNFPYDDERFYVSWYISIKIVQKHKNELVQGRQQITIENSSRFWLVDKKSPKNRDRKLFTLLGPHV